MSFPGHEQDNPQRVSAAVNVAGFVQDVVVATSRLIHGQPLTDRDNRALSEYREMLRRMLSTDLTLERSGERQLAATNAVALLRRARAAHPEVTEDLQEAADAIDRLLAGNRDEAALEHARSLRETFLTLADVNLAAMTRREPGEESSDGWTTLIASSLS